MRELDPKIAEYWLSKAPAVRALADLPRSSQARLDMAKELAGQGHLIDFRLDVAGDHPHKTNKYRLELGYLTVPALRAMGGMPLPGNDPDAPQIEVRLEWAPYVEENPSPVFIRKDTREILALDAEYWVRPGARVNAGDNHREKRFVGFDRNFQPLEQAEILFSAVWRGVEEGVVWVAKRVQRLQPVLGEEVTNPPE